MTRDPGLERVGEDLSMTRRAHAERAITLGSALAVIVAVAGGIALLVVVVWLVGA